MKYKELQTAAKQFNPLLSLEDVFPGKVRKVTTRIVSVFLAFSALLTVITYTMSLRLPYEFSLDQGATRDFFAYWFAYSYGFLLVTLSLRIALSLTGAFYYSYYFKGVESVHRENHIWKDSLCVSYDVARIIHHTSGDDITGSFLKTPLGRFILERGGISEEAVQSFLKLGNTKLTTDNFELNPKGCAHLSEYAEALYKNDPSFSHFLSEHNVGLDDFMGAAGWVEETLMRVRKKERWWSQEALGRIPGIGKEWAYGNVHLLNIYGKELSDHAVFRALDPHLPFGRKEVEEIERVLVRTRDANILLVGEENAGKLEIIARFAKKIKDGRVAPALEHKRIFLLDGSALIAAQSEKAKFEKELLHIFTQAIKAGNIILVIENLPGFIANAHTLGSDLHSLLQPILSSTSLQIIATSGPKEFHETLEHNESFMRYFEKISVHILGEDIILRLLKDSALDSEHEQGIFFTYPALKAIAKGAIEYFGDSMAPGRAADLLAEAATDALKNGKPYITENDVLKLVQRKTGIPLGEVGEKEREKFLNLETVLHKRIVGQGEAVKALANTLRRARTELRDAKRPMGSFLFLGPTGVGKTETAKALAEVFFGGEKEIERLDMSEYAGNDAIGRLLGLFKEGKAGILSSLLREKPYGVLLLDEFEKTNREVHDLFLQILDEGEFKDAVGEKVNARNLIIIATSNAGSDVILDYFKRGENVALHKDEFIDLIIRKGIFKVELLNRFDGVIVFHPLNKEHIREVAVRMLKGLEDRLKEQEIEFVVNNVVIEELLKHGYDSEFGARAMRRTLQDTVEQIIADKKIKGEITSGSRVELTEKDFLDN